MKCFVRFPLFIVLSVIIKINLQAQSFGQGKSVDSLINTVAPNFTLETLEGKSYQLNKLKGKVVVLNFWYLGCAPCLREFPQLNSTREKFKKDKVVFLAISVDGSSENIRKLLTRKTFNYEIIATDFSVAKSYRVKLYPTNVVIDSEGIIKFVKVAYHEDIDIQLSKAIQEALNVLND